MLIRELLEQLKQDGVTVSDIAKTIDGISEKPLRNALKGAGYEFNNKAPKGWYFIGEGEEPLDKEIGEFVPKRERKGKVIQKQKQNHDASIDESIPKASTSKVKSKANKSELDAIDVILQKKANSNKRTYRGFYFDDDVLSVIDGIASGNKSDLVNEALRKVFRDKGLLE